jgi:hypothetical protein
MIALDDIWSKAFGPPDRRPIKDWAAENIALPPVLTKRGKFSTDGSRHFEAPLAALQHDRVRGVRILKPVRGGGTLIADVFAPWAVVNDSASLLWVFQDDKIAEEHAESRQWPILMSVPAIRPMLSADRHKTRKQDILFANGLPFKLTGPALGNLQSKGYKVVICDEPWLYKPGILGQAKARLGDFVRVASSKVLAISQGGDEDSDWDFEYRAGVRYEWRPRCSSCSKPMPIEWSIHLGDGRRAGAVFDSVKNADGTYDKDASAATVRFVCPHCGHEHPNSEKTRAEWNRTGEPLHATTGAPFDPINPPTEVSFRWHALIDYPWGELVKEWLAAQEAKHVGNYAPLVNFFQKRCALMRSERTVHDAELPFTRARIETTDPKAKAWEGEEMRFLTADRQTEDVYWVMVRAWGKSGESRRLWYGRLYSEAAIEEKRIEFGVEPTCVVVDSGYRPKGDHGVYAACIRYGWVAVKGADEPFFWHAVKDADGKTVRVQKAWAPLTYGSPDSGSGGAAPLVRFAAGVMADRVMGLIDRGLWAEPDADDSEDEREYRRQMSAEFKRPKINRLTGRREMIWVCPSGNNHAFDCAKMQVLCALSTALLPDGVDTPSTQPAE